MTELQCDDFYIPEFALMLPPVTETEGYEFVEADNFLKNTEGWIECVYSEEMAE